MAVIKWAGTNSKRISRRGMFLLSSAKIGWSTSTERNRAKTRRRPSLWTIMSTIISILVSRGRSDSHSLDIETFPISIKIK